MFSITNTIKGFLFIALALAFVMIASSTNVFAFGESGGSGSGSGGDSGCGGCGDNSGNTGNNGGGGGSLVNEDSDSTPAAKCESFTISTNKVPHGGGNVTVNWRTTNSNYVEVVGVQTNLPSTGSLTFWVSKDWNIQLHVNGKNGNDNCYVSVKVEAPTTPAKCDFLRVNKNTVKNGGETVTVTWGSSNATGATLWDLTNYVHTTSPNLALSGSKTFFVSKDTTFQLDVWDKESRSSTCHVSVKVEAPTTPTAKCESFTANRTTVKKGETVTLNWVTSNATSASINGTSVTPVSNGSRTFTVNGDTTYTLSVDGNSTDCRVEVRVETTVVNKAPSCDFLNTSATRVTSGSYVKLTWGTTNADTVTLSPNPGNVSKNGSYDAYISGDTTYTLTVKNAQGETSCNVSITTSTSGGSSNTPRCDLEISKTRVNRGDKVTLSWETRYVDEIIIKDDNGKTIFDTNDYSSSKRKNYLDGEIDVIINRDTSFTMTAYGERGGSKTCRVSVKTDDIGVYEKRDQGYVIALTQVPYTGFEAGPFLTFLFYGMLTLWALFIAYVLVIKKGSFLGFSLYGNTATASAVDIENRKKVEALVAKYSGQNQK